MARSTSSCPQAWLSEQSGAPRNAATASRLACGRTTSRLHRVEISVFFSWVIDLEAGDLGGTKLLMRSVATAVFRQLPADKWSNKLIHFRILEGAPKASLSIEILNGKPPPLSISGDGTGLIVGIRR
jgi:hypothetical protein